MNNKFEKIKRAIDKAKKIALFCHVDPDFDCLSSMYGLGIKLKEMGKQVQMYTNEEFGLAENILLDRSLVKIGDFCPEDYDLLISVDTPEAKRLGQYGQQFAQFENVIMIDHHIGNDIKQAKISYLDADSTSCVEIIMQMFDQFGWQITPDIATMFYAGLVTDTNSFKNTNVTIKSLQNAIVLIQKGADIGKVNNAIFRENPLSELAAKKTLYKNLEIINKEIAIATISYRQLVAIGAKKKDCSGFSDQLLSYNGINITCRIVEQQPGVYGLSFRSMPGYDVNVIASRLGGGGHQQASGGTMTGYDDIKKVKAAVVKEIKKYLKEKRANA